MEVNSEKLTDELDNTFAFEALHINSFVAIDKTISHSQWLDSISKDYTSREFSGRSGSRKIAFAKHKRLVAAVSAEGIKISSIQRLAKALVDADGKVDYAFEYERIIPVKSVKSIEFSAQNTFLVCNAGANGVIIYSVEQILSGVSDPFPFISSTAILYYSYIQLKLTLGFQ